VEHQLHQALQEAADLFEENGVLFDWPAGEEFKERFPKHVGSKEMMMFMFRSFTQAWTPIMLNWKQDNYSQVQPWIMFPIGLEWIIGYNLTKSTAAYERLIGESVGATVAAAALT
jgi:hypothetical protein